MINIKHLDKIRKAVPFFDKKVFDKIFTWEELERILNLRPLMNDDRLNIANRSKDEIYEWPVQSWMVDKNTFPPKLLHDIVNERVCHIGDCSRFNKHLNDICGIIEYATNWPTDAHIYFSKKIKNEGYGKHKDKAHNLIVQIEGKSNVKVWSKDDEIIIDKDMTSGDCVFIPAHTYHKLLPLTPRLSVSFPMWIEKCAPPQDRYWINLND